jgi:hypothetical protein
MRLLLSEEVIVEVWLFEMKDATGHLWVGFVVGTGLCVKAEAEGKATEENGGRQAGGTHRKGSGTMMEGRVHHSRDLWKVQAKSFLRVRGIGREDRGAWGKGYGRMW